MTRPPLPIQWTAEILDGLYILVLLGLPSDIELRVPILHILVQGLRRNLPLGWNGPLLVICLVFFGAVLWLSTLPKQ